MIKLQEEMAPGNTIQVSTDGGIVSSHGTLVAATLCTGVVWQLSFDADVFGRLLSTHLANVLSFKGPAVSHCVTAVVSNRS